MGVGGVGVSGAESQESETQKHMSGLQEDTNFTEERVPCPLSLPPPSIPQLVLSHRRLLGEKRRKAQRVKMGKRDMGESEQER